MISEQNHTLSSDNQVGRFETAYLPNLVPKHLRSKPQEQIDVPPQILSTLGNALQASLHIWDLKSTPKYELYFKSGSEPVEIAGGIVDVTLRNENGTIREHGMGRRVGASPAKIANIAFSIVSTIVAQEHLARIDRKLGDINSNLVELKSCINDEIAAPIRIACNSLHRIDDKDSSKIPAEIISIWLNQLKLSRERIIPIIYRNIGKISVSDSWFFSSILADTTIQFNILHETISLIELLMSCDSIIENLCRDESHAWAEDGIDFSLPIALSKMVLEKKSKLVQSMQPNLKKNVDHTGENRKKVDALTQPITNRTENIIRAVEHWRDIRNIRDELSSESDLVFLIENGRLTEVRKIL